MKIETPNSKNTRTSILGKIDKTKPLIIIGAGISGLIAGYYAKKAGIKVRIYEKEKEVGGLIATNQTPHGPAECAAHSFLMTEVFQNLLRDLKLEAVPLHPKHKARYIFKKKRLRKFPLSPLNVATLLWKGSTKKMNFSKTETLEEWGIQHLGEAVTNYLLEPALQGIYAGDPSRMSVSAVMPKLCAAEGKTLLKFIFSESFSNKKSKSAKGMFSLKEGAGALPQALREFLKNEIILNTKIENLEEFQKEGAQILLCVDAKSAGKLLSTLPELLESESMMPLKLKNVEYLPLITNTVFVKKTSLKKFKEGVGVLIAPTENIRTKGILFNSSAFSYRTANPEEESLTVILGGAKDLDCLNLTDENLQKIIIKELNITLGLNEVPEHIFTKRYERALPHYTKALEELWVEIQKEIPSGIALFGNYTGTISVRGLIEAAAIEWLN